MLSPERSDSDSPDTSDSCLGRAAKALPTQSGSVGSGRCLALRFLAVWAPTCSDLLTN
jgi:hypothetical protein